jgi:hypothetical protein
MKNQIIFALTLFVLTNSLSQAKSWKDNLNLRNGRKLLETNSIPCKTESGNSCECPGACMTPNNSTNQCELKKCYGWDKNLGKCEETGPKFVPAIVLQAIPFTGVFGSGFGNMGRWDLFGISMGIFFGGCSFLLFGVCCVMAFSSSDESRHGFGQCISTCGVCLWAIAVLAYYIWGIVVIVNKEVLGPNGCPLV